MTMLHTATDDRAYPIVHQDVKPDNILLTQPPDGSPVRAKLADFGLARVAPDLARESVFQLQTQTLAGTRGYVAPELINGGKVSTRTDSFAFGVVLLQLLTSKPTVCSASGELLIDEMCDLREDTSRLSPAHLDTAGGSWDVEAARRMLKVADRCVHALARRRVEVRDVLAELEALVESGSGGQVGFITITT